MYSCGCSSLCMLCTCGTYLKHYITFLILCINVVFVAIYKLGELHVLKQFTEGLGAGGRGSFRFSMEVQSGG